MRVEERVEYRMAMTGYGATPHGTVYFSLFRMELSRP